MPQLSRSRQIIIAVVAVAIIVLGVLLITGSSSPTSTPTVVTLAGDCKISQLLISPPGAPAHTPGVTYVGLAITNTAKTSCKMSKALQSEITSPHSSTTLPLYGYGIMYAKAWSSAAPLGPVSVLRGTAGSQSITLRPGPTPSAEFTLGITNAALVKGCTPRRVTSLAFSLNGTDFQPVSFSASPYFTKGVTICTAVTNLNTSPVSVIPLTSSTKRTTTPKS